MDMATWSMDHDYFSNLSIPCPKEAPHEILSNTGPEASEEKSFEIITIFSIQMYRAHTNAYGSKLDLTVRRSNVDVRPSF